MTNTHLTKSFVEQLNNKMKIYKNILLQEMKYINKNYNTSEIVKNNMKNWFMIRKIKSIRGIYLFLNKYKYKNFTYNEMKIWITASIQQIILLNESQIALSLCNEADKKYIRLYIKTLNNFGINYKELPRRSERLMQKRQQKHNVM